LFLHATRLRLTLPGTGPLELEAALDHQLEAILDKLRN
jgi:hypothetical protein